MPTLVFTLLALVVIVFVAAKFETHRRQKKMQAAPRITQAEVDAFRQSLAAATLPMAKMVVTGAAAGQSTESRIGGQPFSDLTHSDWPTYAEDGSPMLFLAQINFAEVPHLPDFPRAGILQLFAAGDARGHIEDTALDETRVIRWFPEPSGDQTLVVPREFLTLKKRGTLSPRAIANGLAVRFVSAEAKGHPYNWPFEQTGPDTFNRLGETPEVEADSRRLESEADTIRESYGTHWVAGQPSFVQEDVRYQTELQSFDRVLLHLGFDDDVCIGDAGELNLMIRRQDLLARDFQKAFCTWDCG
jgi:uncharacterized protein YwqG